MFCLQYSGYSGTCINIYIDSNPLKKICLKCHFGSDTLHNNFSKKYKMIKPYPFLIFIFKTRNHCMASSPWTYDPLVLASWVPSYRCGPHLASFFLLQCSLQDHELEAPHDWGPCNRLTESWFYRKIAWTSEYCQVKGKIIFSIYLFICYVYVYVMHACRDRDTAYKSKPASIKCCPYCSLLPLCVFWTPNSRYQPSLRSHFAGLLDKMPWMSSSQLLMADL